jgi:hypothetical protein
MIMVSSLSFHFHGLVHPIRRSKMRYTQMDATSIADHTNTSRAYPFQSHFPNSTRSDATHQVTDKMLALCLLPLFAADVQAIVSSN